jgi:signal transduction histidine kinase
MQANTQSAKTASARTSLSDPKAPKGRMDFQKLRQRIIDFSPLIIFAIILIVISIALVNLTITISSQVTLGTSIINNTLADQNRVYVQLQREALRFLSLVNRPEDEFDEAAVQQQYELLLSRINHMRRTSIQAIMAPQMAAEYSVLDVNWDTLDVLLQEWMSDPEDASLREEAATALAEYERQINNTQSTYIRISSAAISEFATTNQQIPITFAIVLVAFVGLIVAAIFATYRFVLQARETVAIREVNQVKDQFVAIMSHELRTPLNAIIGFLGIMKMGGDLPEKQVHMVDRSRANAERLLSLIDDILDMSKIEAGRFDLHPEVVTIRDLNQRWISQTEVLAAEKKLQFSATVDHSVPEKVYIDPDALTKIVTNLLSNALKFTKEGSVFSELKQVSDKLEVKVKDTGVGIPDEAQQTIFESFRQLDSSTKRKFGGSGLGLFIVKQLTTLLEGTIEVTSKVNEGSTFVVRIPLKPIPAATGTAGAAASPSTLTSTPIPSTKT